MAFKIKDGVRIGTVDVFNNAGALLVNAPYATALATARTIAISGAVTGTATSFDGSANITISATALAAGNLSGTIPSAVLGASSHFIGTTSIALDRASGAQTLTGISIDGNAGTVTNGVYTTGSYADPAWITSLAKSKVGLGNVENTALSTWAGSSNITTIGAATATSLVVSGTLTVNGTTTTVNSTTVTLDDPIITLGGDTAPASDDSKDRGVEFRWHNGTVAKVGFFGFDDSTGKFTFIPDATNASEVFSGTKGVLDASIEWADILNKPAVGTGSVTSVALSLPAIFSVTGSPVTTSGTLTASLASQTANTVFAAPNGSAGAPTFRALVAADIPALTLENVPDAWVKRSVKAATTANITLNAPQTVDGIALIAGDRVLVKDQTTASQNGIYVVQAAAWTRAADANLASELAAAAVAVDAGTTNGGFTFDTDFKSTDTLDTTAITWNRVLDAGSIKTVNGTSLVGTGNLAVGTVTSVGGTGTVSGLTLSGTVTSTGNLTLGGTLAVTASNFSSQTANTFLSAPNGAAGVPTFRAIVAADIPTLNQNTTGTAANVTGTVAVANGGTGSTTAAGARTNLGATTAGSNLFTLANPSAITFLRVNADNTVSALDAATFRTAIGAQASGTYLTAEADTLATVTGRGATTSSAIEITNTTAGGLLGFGALIVAGGITVGNGAAIKGDVVLYHTVNASTGTLAGLSNIIRATVATTTATALDSFTATAYRSGKYLVQIQQGTNYQTSEVLVVHNGTTTTMTEYAVLETNGTIATLTSDINAGNVRLLVTMGSTTSATITLTKLLMAV